MRRASHPIQLLVGLCALGGVLLFAPQEGTLWGKDKGGKSSKNPPSKPKETSAAGEAAKPKASGKRPKVEDQGELASLEPKTAKPIGRVEQAVRPELYPQSSEGATSVLLRRAEALLAHLSAQRDMRDLSAERAELLRLRSKIGDGANEKSPAYAELQALYRRIALANPLLNFDKLVFIKRNRARAGHMVDQFLGTKAVPGGGLYVLEDCFGREPRLVDVLENSVVVNGRLRGQPLRGGAWLSPSLSYDGRTIVFAYCECGKATSANRPGWGAQTVFHLFKVHVDGTELTQLTDGELNDFHPCWLPNGRIAFMSERRGGYGRCHGGRDAPSYTLASIKPDGSDLVFLSYGEANEWHPSVTNDGRIVYTRWDYLDRGTNQAHHPWITSLDGRDARAIHGNYPPSAGGLRGRPWAEYDVRAIPGSTKFVATAGGHHSPAYGSLVLLDPNVPDDGASAQVRRLTPEAPYPEGEGGGGSYATAWPLDEDFFLCARGSEILLIDSFGERLSLYRSGNVPPLSPIPLRPRPLPHLPPHLTAEGLPPGVPRQAAKQPPAEAEAPQANVAVMNAYDGTLPWPAGTRLTALRIIQVYPQPTNRGNKYCGTGRTNVRDVLGTVPLEPDGSAYFTVPANKAIYFQALDERGLAVQSMRSVTYTHPGETLTCHGCHERRHRAPAVAEMPRALRRGPSAIVPEPKGSNPFDFQTLVQPVFEEKCNACHRAEKAVSLSRTTAMKYVPYFTSPKPFEPSLTTPGKFGALGSKLLKYLDKSHHGVSLSAEEFRRITLWMDCNAAAIGSNLFSEDERNRLAEFNADGRKAGN